MKQRENLTTTPIDTTALGKRMLIGAAIALLWIAFFLFPTEGLTEWGKFWIIRPLAIVTFAGSVGGACYYFLNYYTVSGSAKRILANIIGGIIYVFGLWIGTILGLAGTLWN